MTVPPLRKLRTLPLDEQVADQASSTWTPRHSIAFGGSLLTLVLLAVAGWMTLTQPETPEFGKIYQQQLANVAESSLESWKPLDFWLNWQVKEPALLQHGFNEISTPQQEVFVDKLDERLLHRNIVLATAGVVAALTIVGCFAWPKPVA